MSKIVFPLRAAPKRRWLADFVTGLVRGFMTVGASATLTAFTLLILKANGYLG